MFDSTIHRLRVFQYVVELGSFSAVARKLNITQPSISAHIQALEQELGKSLFIRNPGRKAKLTEAGDIVYSHAKEITSRTDQVVQSLQRLQEKPKKVSIAAQPHVANILLPAYLDIISKTHPDIDILIYSQTLEAVIDHVRKGKADLGLVKTLENIEGLHQEVLDSENLELVIAPNHELAQKSRISHKELEKYSFVGGLKSSMHAKMLDLYLKKIGLTQYNQLLQVEDYKTMIEVAKRGLGIAILSASSIQDELNEGKLVKLSLESEPIKTELKLIYSPHIKISDEARLFMVFLRRKMSR